MTTDEEAAAFLAAQAEPVPVIRTSRDVVVNAVGPALYETFFQGYTRKQWGLDPSELDKSVTSRVPTRTNRDSRYFTDTYQAMPLHGYTRMFEKMLDHPNIKVMLNTDYREILELIPHGHLIYTGPVDAFFGHQFGKLPYRSLEFRHETHDTAQLLPVGTVKVNAVFGGAPGGSADPRGDSGAGRGYGPDLLGELVALKAVHWEPGPPA